jgi:hypothetical protein
MACKPSLVFVPSFIPILVSFSLDGDNRDENTPPTTHLPLDDSNEHEPAPTPSLPRWICSTREAVGDLTVDPLAHCRIRSHF